MKVSIKQRRNKVNKTKIICSIGPASNNIETLEKMINAGMNIARFNMSHGTHESHKEMYENVSKASKNTKKKIEIILDTKGPEIRIRDFENGKVNLKNGDMFTLTTEEILGNEKQVSVTYKNLPKILKKGNQILLNDGNIELKVEKTTKTTVECKIVNGGELSNKKSINLPGIPTKLDFLSEQDKSDLAFAKEINADYIALSFVSYPEDVISAREYLNSVGNTKVKLISKIESAEGVKNFDKILKVTDGIMVARGDLGVEIDYAKIPYLQKQFIKKCNEAQKFVVTATQMMESMTNNPRPTRAEISDVANAVFDGTDAVMLSGESANGKYPIETVAAMRKIANEAEKHL